jgi:hypothetical protein
MKEEVFMADCITCCHGQNPRRRGTEKSNCQKQPERQTSIGNPPFEENSDPTITFRNMITKTKELKA